MQVKNSPINWKHLQKEFDPMRPTVKVLTLMQRPSDYCSFMKLMYSAGYRITKHAKHPRCIYLDLDTFGYIECRDATKSVYKFVIYGCDRRDNNARVVYLENRKGVK
jgi:hypothetical protein